MRGGAPIAAGVLLTAGAAAAEAPIDLPAPLGECLVHRREARAEAPIACDAPGADLCAGLRFVEGRFDGRGVREVAFAGGLPGGELALWIVSREDRRPLARLPLVGEQAVVLQPREGRRLAAAHAARARALALSPGEQVVLYVVALRPAGRDRWYSALHAVAWDRASGAFALHLVVEYQEDELD